MPLSVPRGLTASMEQLRPERPAPHLEPPDDLASRPILVVDTARTWTRMHRCRHSALHFGSGGENRFDAPNGEYGVLYAGADPHCAFIETFGDVTNPRGRIVVTWQALADRCLTRIAPSRPLKLVDLTGPGLARIGADARLSTGPHGVAQRWALALWQTHPYLDGILYRARHDPERTSAAIFDNRAAGILRALPPESLVEIDSAALIADLLDHYGIGLVANNPMS